VVVSEEEYCRRATPLYVEVMFDHFQTTIVNVSIVVNVRCWNERSEVSDACLSIDGCSERSGDCSLSSYRSDRHFIDSKLHIHSLMRGTKVAAMSI
jgi:hypothetical protein